MKSDKRLPYGYVEYLAKPILSNYHGQFNEDVATILKVAKLYACYAGWNFNCLVWWEDGLWFCEVWHRKEWQYSLEADTLEEIRKDVSSVFGKE